jgi:hypothetical protein
VGVESPATPEDTRQAFDCAAQNRLTVVAAIGENETRLPGGRPRRMDGDAVEGQPFHRVAQIAFQNGHVIQPGEAAVQARELHGARHDVGGPHVLRVPGALDGGDSCARAKLEKTVAGSRGQACQVPHHVVEDGRVYGVRRQRVIRIVRSAAAVAND